MSSWSDSLLNKLNLDGAFVYIVDDADGLCFEPLISNTFENKNAQLIDERDPLAIRLSFEQWRDKKATTPLLIRVSDDQVLNIPYDISVHAKRISFHLGEICPELDTQVLRHIPPSAFQLVIDALKVYRPGLLAPQASTDFILRHVYKIAPEVIQSNADVVRLLIRKHYIGIAMPAFFEQRLVTLLELNPKLKDWNFVALIPSKSQFFEFLQQQWSRYIASLRPNQATENPLYSRKDLVVPFDDADIRILIDNLFADGVLLPVTLDHNDLPEGHWAAFGIQTPYINVDYERCKRLYDQSNRDFETLDDSTISHEFWKEQSHGLGILNALSYQLTEDDIDPIKLKSLKEKIALLNSKADALFESWLIKHFSALQTLPTVNVPLMLHKIPNWLASKVACDKKVCLLVLDGLGARQWPLLRKLLQEKASLQVEEHSCFAWVPTITSISRQALFSGKRPFAFADSLLTTSKEGSLWRDFWTDHGLTPNQVLFTKKAENLNQEAWQNLIYPSDIKAAGIVINFVDEQMHGMKAGMAGLNSVVELWLNQWGFIDKITALINQGFEIVLTADHGSQETKGIGSISDGVKAETKGERVRIYNTSHTQLSSAESMDESVVAWPGPSFGLPQNCFPVLAKSAYAFKPKGDSVVGHGGISLHEVVVPLAVITSKPIRYE